MDENKIAQLKEGQARIQAEAARPVESEDDMLFMVRPDESKQNYVVNMAGHPPQILHALVSAMRQLIQSAPEDLQAQLQETVVQHLTAPKENN